MAVKELPPFVKGGRGVVDNKVSSAQNAEREDAGSEFEKAYCGMIRGPDLLETTDDEMGAKNEPENGDYYRVLCHNLIMSQEEERRRLRRELGDHIAQDLAAMAIEAGRIEKAAEKSAAPLLEWIGNLKNSSLKLSEDAHLFCRRLYPAILEELGLVEAIRSECLAFYFEKGIDVRFLPRAVPSDLPLEPAICIFRLVQEALKNIGQHTSATKVVVLLGAKGDSLRLVIRDNGLGSDIEELRKRSALGSCTMRVRVNLIGGSFKTRAKPGSGLQIRVRIPLSRGSAGSASDEGRLSHDNGNAARSDP